MRQDYTYVLRDAQYYNLKNDMIFGFIKIILYDNVFAEFSNVDIMSKIATSTKL